ncbi:hypothetical protein [uncultured Croceitalea sp.]|uniref:hypothetical protein n=1 Tax=uncultured Croceitalea sp. TaxID=1798908 RepID=UPI00374FCB53
MESVDESEAIDNMVIVDKGAESTTAIVVRHLPTDNWYAGRPMAEDFGNNFSGKLQLFSAENGLVVEVDMENGGILGKDSESNNSTGRGGCSISSVSYAGLSQAGVFYITNINIIIDCDFGSGSGGDPFDLGNGSDPDEEEDNNGSGSSDGGNGGVDTSFLEFELLSQFCQENGFILSPQGDGCLVDEPFILNPCKQMDQAEQDSALKSKLNELKGKVNDNREFGRLITGTNPTTFSNLFAGQPNDGGINFSTGSKIDGFVHSHYNGLLPVFSGSDLKVIYDLHKQGKIRKWKTFTAYLVTNGTTYALKIDDIDDFLAFGDVRFKTTGFFQLFEAQYAAKINTTNTNGQNELAFANLIKESGLKLFKGNPLNFGTWTSITSNSAETGIINDNCN